MKTFEHMALVALLVALHGCGQLVEFGDEDSPKAGRSGATGSSGSSGRGGAGGKGGSSGVSGTVADGGADDDSGTLAGRGGTGGTSGARGGSGTGGGSGVGGDRTAPIVMSTTPTSNAVNVAIDSSVTATFSESVDPATINDTTFTLMQGTTVVEGVVKLAGNTATFTPKNALAGATPYDAKISSGAKDRAGNPLASDYRWTFTTKDNDRPLVIAKSPAPADMQVALNKTVTATFDEPLDALSVTDMTFNVTGPGLTPVMGMVSYDASKRVATFDPNNDLMPSTNYTVTLTPGVMDLAGNPLMQAVVWTFMTGTTPAQTVIQMPVPLGAASAFVILASAGITNIPTSMITGDIGLSPDTGANIMGFSMPASCPEIVGTMWVVDAAGPACAMIDPVRITNAKLAAQAAFLSATGSVRGPPQAISGDLNGLTLYPGLYESGSSLEISAGGFLYLDAQGDPNAVFIIRSATSITTLATSAVVLTKGAKAANIFWTAGSAITLGTDSFMKGTMIAGTAISLLNGANLQGRALNQGPAAAAITLQANTITRP